ncbi:methyltransferase domain-containing protein [Halosimplex rubrum]|uniref:Methyltransferase domain-containing protein n=1 Tax=Halosimplex rubrum TaxID=869889 RepID=A0A7D5P4L1_9EURY|nr:class I SAM-dependent methyltransferase [Halosimplex rubrum]QLH78981.1 methyltransferase domain-containing protein [Halosimplex rubrum]
MGGIHYLVENASASDTVLDVGSKTGGDMNKLSCDTISIDIKFQETNYDTNYILADGTLLSFKDNSFDFVLCSQVLEHIKDTEGIVKEISRVLKPKGEAIFNFPNRLAPKSPHLPPWWYSYLPHRIGHYLSDDLLDEETAKYYRESEFMLTPLKARWFLNRHFDFVEYWTFKHKSRYEDELRQEADVFDNRYHKVMFGVSPVLSEIETLPLIGGVIELFYPSAAYICTNSD